MAGQQRPKNPTLLQRAPQVDQRLLAVAGVDAGARHVQRGHPGGQPPVLALAQQPLLACWRVVGDV